MRAREIEADVIIGADGIHSALRASLFGPDAPRFSYPVRQDELINVVWHYDNEDYRHET